MKNYDDVVEFHGHSCPGLALGYRVSLRALREFKKRSEDEELVAIVENNSCAVDAVQAMTGCTFGKGNLIFRDFGKQVYTFIVRPSGRGIRISVDWKRPPETEAEKTAWERYAGGDRSKKVIQIVHDRKAARVRHILDIDDRELMKVTKSEQKKLPPQAEIYRSIVCERCGEKVAEPKVRIKDGNLVCIPCMEGKR
ncbi:MAG TPA: FmdE family protein [Candidatus Sulfobium mesophilum]|jgi:formylmethanofuran dehydrogenase subunit E|nr:FmdE family protein [Candidatus Sulfobium mesophilum]